ncbi:putative Ig domain-containing protein [Myxococcus stipitatus]|uniref:putative Ig domain-containing protein n=1 Tax=Myxococcus stipitatus TaxID=83455 RepID=UPI002278E2F9|nr:putative Ig domain-containing protein [Myxococcus stipitatus]
MRLTRALASLLVLFLAACPGSKSVTPPITEQDAGTRDGGDTALSLDTTALPEAYLGDAYATLLAASGGKPPYAWSIGSGALPPGLQLAASGHLTGFPATSGSFALAVVVQDASGASSSRELTLSVLSPPAIAGTTLPLGVVGAPYSTSIDVHGGRAPLSLHVTTGALPPGLSLEAHSLSGTPTSAIASAFTLEVRDANGRSASASFELTIRDGLTITPTTLPDAYSDTAYRQTLTSLGGKAPFRWSLVSGALPSGLSLLDSGLIEGTASTLGTSSFTVKVTDADGASDTREVTLTTYLPPLLAPLSTTSAYTQDAVAIALQAAQGKAPYVFSASGPVPPGLVLAPEGLLHGQPSQAGTFSFELTARDANGRNATRAITFTVHARPTISTQGLPDATSGQAYSQQLTANGGQGTLTWRLASGALPIGLSLGANGTISGTPTTPGTASFTVSATDTGGRSDSRALSLSVYSAPLITTGTLADGYVTTPYSATVSASGGRAPYTWSLHSGALPAGISLAPGTGVISGSLGATPSSASFTLRVTDSGGRIGLQSFLLHVLEPPTLSGVATALSAYVSNPFDVTYIASGGRSPLTFYTSSMLPPGLTLSANGTLTGTPTTTNTWSGTILVADANGRTASQAFSITVYTLPAITTSSLPEAQGGAAYSHSLAATGGRPPLSWSISSGALPLGLSLSTTGALSGSTTAASSTFTARVTDSNGRFAERPLTLPVYLPPVITTTTLPGGLVGQSYATPLTANGQAPFTWSTLGALPAGLTLTSDGELTGVPTSPGTTSFTAVVQDARGASASRPLSLVVSGTGQLFTVGQWNLEWFGADNLGPPDDLQVTRARDILLGVGANLWGLVEMVDAQDFANLKSQLPGYSGFLANDTSYVPGGAAWYSTGEQKPGILYDDSLTFSGAQLVLTESAFSFGGRPPLRVDLLANFHGVQTPLVVIVMHMKAFADLESYTRRQEASLALKTYLDGLPPSTHAFVIGDWNDDVDVSITRENGVNLPTPFANFLEDTAHYTFVTRPLSLAGERTTVEYRDAIDHTLVSDDVAAHYVYNSVRVLRPDTTYPDYVDTVSDHYPVISRYDFGGGGSPDAGTGTPPVVFINEVLANEPAVPIADGGTAADSHYEFIEVVNTGGSPADLSGWTLQDAVATRHTFATGTVIAPGKAYVVFGGPRGFIPGTPDTVAASSGQLGLNNDTDTVSLRAGDGTLVDTLSYSSTRDNTSINRDPDAQSGASFVLHTVLNPALTSSPGRRANGGAF